MLIWLKHQTDTTHILVAGNELFRGFMHKQNPKVAARVTQAMRTLPRDHFIEMSNPSLVLGRSIPPTNAVSEILNHANIQPDHKMLLVGTGPAMWLP